MQSQLHPYVDSIEVMFLNVLFFFYIRYKRAGFVFKEYLGVFVIGGGVQLFP